MTGYLATMLAAAMLFLFPGGSLALEPSLVEDADHAWRSVQGSSDGNPMVGIRGVISGAGHFRERFTDIPGWIVSEDFDGDRVYEAAVQFTDGTLRVLSLTKGRLRTVSVARNMAPAAAPVIVTSLGGDPTGGLVGIDDRGELVSVDFDTGRTRRLASGFSSLSHPVAMDLDGDGLTEIAAVSEDGYLTVVKGRTQTRSSSAVPLLPDTRLTATDLDGDHVREIIALSRPSEEYSPGRLGDDLEAHGVAVFTWDGRTLDLEADLELGDGQIFETLTALIVSDQDGGEAVLVFPVTRQGKGTELRSYSYRNGRVREKRRGPASASDQWIHILGSSVLGDSDQVLLMTSLAGGGDKNDLVLYRYDLAQTRTTMSSTVKTHTAGSRTLEVSLVGDFDGDGKNELMIPGAGGTGLLLVKLERNRLKATEVFTSSSPIVTNLCPGDFNGDGYSDVIFGTADGTLVVLTGE